jgi:hypothetical protein
MRVGRAQPYSGWRRPAALGLLLALLAFSWWLAVRTWSSGVSEPAWSLQTVVAPLAAGVLAAWWRRARLQQVGISALAGVLTTWANFAFLAIWEFVLTGTWGMDWDLPLLFGLEGAALGAIGGGVVAWFAGRAAPGAELGAPIAPARTWRTQLLAGVHLGQIGAVALLLALGGLGGAGVWSATDTLRNSDGVLANWVVQGADTAAFPLAAGALVVAGVWNLLATWKATDGAPQALPRAPLVVGLLLAAGAAVVLAALRPWQDTLGGDAASATVTRDVLIGLLPSGTLVVVLLVAGAFGRLSGLQTLVGIGAAMLATFGPVPSLVRFTVVVAAAVAIGVVAGRVTDPRYWAGLGVCLAVLVVVSASGQAPATILLIPVALLALACAPLVLVPGRHRGPPRLSHRGLALAAALVPVAVLAGWTWAGAAVPTWADQSVARSGHGATLLTDGRVLVDGGTNAPPSNGSALLYEPTSGAWSRTGSLVSPRRQQTAVRLRDGQVLVVGGGQGLTAQRPYVPPASAEMYDPASGSWRVTSGGVDGGGAALLPDGRVLVVGFPWREGGPTPVGPPPLSAGLYDLTGETWTDVAAPTGVWMLTGLAPLPDGRVLLVGRQSGTDGGQSLAAVYDATTDTWSPIRAPSVPRAGAAMVPLADGRVLLAGGGWDTIFASAEVYDPSTGAWQSTGSMGTMRNEPTAVLLSDGRVLVSGGHVLPGGPQPPAAGHDRPLVSAELYDPRSGQWSDAAPMQTARAIHSLTLLRDGQVLAAGGSTQPFQQGLLTSAEVYDPAADTWSPTGDMAAVVRGDPTPSLLALAFFWLLTTGVFGLLLGVSSAPLHVGLPAWRSHGVPTPRPGTP